MSTKMATPTIFDNDDKGVIFEVVIVMANSLISLLSKILLSIMGLFLSKIC